MEEMLEEINKVLNSRDITKNLRIDKIKMQDGKIILSSFMDDIVFVWYKLDQWQKERISEIIFKGQIKNYIGDVKWVLYNYICNLQELYPTEVIRFICGRFAYNKLSAMGHFIRDTGCYDHFNLNGEVIDIIESDCIDKKQIIIAIGANNEQFVTLYFA